MPGKLVRDAKQQRLIRPIVEGVAGVVPDRGAVIQADLRMFPGMQPADAAAGFYPEGRDVHRLTVRIHPHSVQSVIVAAGDREIGAEIDLGCGHRGGSLTPGQHRRPGILLAIDRERQCQNREDGSAPVTRS